MLPNAIHRVGLMAPALAVAFGFTLNTAAQAQVVWRDGRPVFQSEQQASRPDPSKRRGRYPEIMQGGGRPSISPEEPDIVDFPNALGAGNIVIDTRARKLYYVISSGSAYQYPISVGREGFKWYGTEKVSRVQSWPSWTPPPEMRKRQPYLPKTMLGGVRNPLGAKAIYLGSTLYRIHGTNQPRTIGRASSSGCFRMMNKHVLHLATLVQVGTTVRVVRRWDGAATKSSAAPAPKDKRS